MTVVTPDEYTILEIAATGKSMMPIGRWEQPTESLIAKGMMKPSPPSAQDPTGRFNCFITDAGRAAIKAYDQEVYGGIIEQRNKRVQQQPAQTEMQQHIRSAATYFYKALDAVMQATGDTEQQAKERLLPLLKQALEKAERERQS